MRSSTTFGPFTLDRDRRQLFEGKREVHLTPKVYELLTLLVTERPRALSKTEIHQHLWPDTFVGEATLARLVADLREALGTRGHEETYVRTVHGFGYAFVADASEAPAAGPAPVSRLSWTWFDAADGDRRYALHEGANQIGRNATAEVCLDDSTVSRHHARIVVTPAGVTLEDLGSRNGTFVNGAQATSPVPLRDGDDVKIGSVRLRFRTLAEPGTTVVATES